MIAGGKVRPNSLQSFLSRRAPAAWTDPSRIAPVLVLAAALAIRLHGLASQSLWQDETASIAFAHLPLSRLWSAWMIHENNPPLYYSLLHVWIAVFGDSEVAVRAPSAILGASAVAGLYVLVRKIAAARAAVLAAALMGLSALQVYYSQEARAYMLEIVAVLMVLIAVIDIAGRMTAGETAAQTFPGRSVWVVYALAMTVALYSHTTMVVFLLLINIYVAGAGIVAGRRDGRPWTAWLGANAVCVILWSWWGWITVHQMAVPSANLSWMTRPTLHQIAFILNHVYGPVSRSLQHERLTAVVTLALLALAAFGVWRARHPARWLLALVAFGAPLMFVLLSFIKPIFLERTIVWVQIAYLPLLAVGIAQIPVRTVRYAGACVLAAVYLAGLVHSEAAEVKQPWRQAVQVIAREGRPGDVVFVTSVPAGVAVEYYCRRLACGAEIVAMQSGRRGISWAPDVFHGRVVNKNDVTEVLRTYPRVWSLFDSSAPADAYLRTIATPGGRTRFFPFTYLIGPRTLQLTPWHVKPQAMLRTEAPKPG